MIGDKIRQRLDELQMTNRHLAKSIGVDDPVISRYIWNTITPNPYRLYEISKVLEVPMEYFFEED